MIYNEDCISGSSSLPDRSIDLLVCDPPFGIGEGGFNRHYARSADKVISGYVESPSDYYTFTRDWMKQSIRVLKDDGSIYVFSGWSRLLEVMYAARKVGFDMINHIIWKYNFGVHTTKKFVSSHYHVLYMKKADAKGVKFNTYCRFGASEREDGGSLLYRDMEDVWCINKEYHPSERKNYNKLPDALLEKIILYSSDEGDVVGDFFLGNFTTAVVAKGLGRTPVGFEINPEAYADGVAKLQAEVPGGRLLGSKVVDPGVPSRRGERMGDAERSAIVSRFLSLRGSGYTKKDAIGTISDEQSRGRFSIINVIKGSGL